MAYEDLSTYTEVDQNGDITYSGTGNIRANGNAVSRSNTGRDAYFYKDFGAGHFGDYTHLVDMYLSSSTQDGGTTSGFWGITNTIDELNGWAAGIYVRNIRNSGYFIRIGGVGGTTDTYTGLADTNYYTKIERAGTTATCKIYSDAARTNLLSTESITVSTTTYRYLYPLMSLNDGYTASVFVGWGENYDLGEAAGGTILPQMLQHHGG